jgi:L-asparaginase
MTVVVISTGGTIASTEDSGGDASPELTGADLLASVPELGQDTTLTTDDFSNVPSAHFTIEQMYELSELIAAYDRDDTVDGVVVTQGTDVLEESAYFIDRTFGGETPVVFTGAMRNPSLSSSDGPANLLTAVRTAESDEARGRGVMVAFNDRIHAARTVTKCNSMNLDTFRSPEFGPLATRDESRIRWRAAMERTTPVELNPDRLTNRVAALTVTVDMFTGQIPAPTECDALVFAATGAGHIPPSFITPLEEFSRADVPLVATTRCPEGRLARSTYDFLGSEATLRELGCYYSDSNLQKARIETIVALAGDALEETFDRP